MRVFVGKCVWYVFMCVSVWCICMSMYGVSVVVWGVVCVYLCICECGVCEGMCGGVCMWYVSVCVLEWGRTGKRSCGLLGLTIMGSGGKPVSLSGKE